VRAFLAGVASVLLLLGCQTPSDPQGVLHDPPWIELRTEHLTIWTNVHERTARRLARNLEQFRAVVELVSARRSRRLAFRSGSSTSRT
jgi:hypothetical protein